MGKALPIRRVKAKKIMTARNAIDFIRQHGVVLASGKGPVPRLSEAIIGSSIKGSWWAHPRSHDIFRVFRVVGDSDDILVCRLMDGKVTFVYRWLWPALVRMADHFSARQLEEARQEHTRSGYHVARSVPFPKWVPPEVLEKAKLLTEGEALGVLACALPKGKLSATQPKRLTRRSSRRWCVPASILTPKSQLSIVSARQPT